MIFASGDNREGLFHRVRARPGVQLHLLKHLHMGLIMLNRFYNLRSIFKKFIPKERVSDEDLEGADSEAQPLGHPLLDGVPEVVAGLEEY